MFKKIWFSLDGKKTAAGSGAAIAGISVLLGLEPDGVAEIIVKTEIAISAAIGLVGVFHKIYKKVRSI